MVKVAPRRFPLLPIAGLASVLIAAVAAALISRSVSHANRWIDQSVRVQAATVQLSERLSAQESAYRGYTMRGDAALLPDLAQADAGIASRLALLRADAADNPHQIAHIDLVTHLIAERTGYMIERKAERDRLGGLPPVTQSPHGRPLALRIRAILSRMFDEEEARLVARQRQTERLTQSLSIALAASVLLIVVVAYMTLRDARARYRATIEAHDAARAEITARESAEARLAQSQKMESIGQLSGGIAHDFNNMLAVIIGSLDMAARADDPDRVTHYVASARDGADRAATLVARLLAFSRQQALAPATIDPNQMVRGMLELLERTLGEQIAIAIDLGPATWPINVDPGQLENAILNLALNGRDAMEQGGTITLVTHNRTLDATYADAHPDVAPGDYAMIAISDEGSGMSEDVRARAFEPFFTTKGIGKGTGLGLSQVFGFVKQSGGHVVIEPRPTRGSTVRLYLPRSVDALPSAARDGGGTPLAGGRGERILVVEDDERVRSFSVEALRELGYTPIAAENGVAALEMLRGGADPVLLFTDIVMPLMGGVELSAMVRSERPAVKLLYTTGYARDADRLGATLDTTIGLLAKPFTVAQLALRVREALDS